MKTQTTIDNIFYYQEKAQDILNLGLKFSFEEIGFYLTFKAAYFFHKGKIPISKILQFCRVFDQQEKFTYFIKANFQELDGFIICQSFDEDIIFIEEKSKKRKDAINSRWKNTIVDTKEDTIENDLNILNTKHKTLNTKHKTLITNNILEEFELFWNRYDKKVSRADAEKKFIAALKKDAFENIMTGLDNYIKTRSPDSQYWKNPATWLNQECWKDEYIPKSNNQQSGSSKIDQFRHL